MHRDHYELKGKMLGHLADEKTATPAHPEGENLSDEKNRIADDVLATTQQHWFD